MALGDGGDDDDFRSHMINNNIVHSEYLSSFEWFAQGRNILLDTHSIGVPFHLSQMSTNLGQHGQMNLFLGSHLQSNSPNSHPSKSIQEF